MIKGNIFRSAVKKDKHMGFEISEEKAFLRVLSYLGHVI